MTASPKLVREFRANQEILRVLEASKALSESIVDELPIVLVMVDNARRILKLNREGQRFFGREEAAVLGKDIGELVPASTREHLAAYFDGFPNDTADGVTFEDQFTLNHELKYYHWQVSAVYSTKDGRRQVHVLIGNDTSEARAALENLVVMRKDLEVASAVQTMLLPTSATREAPYFRMAGHYEPSAQVGGDFWWYLVVPGRGLLAIVADAMGHGVGSAMAAATLGGALQALVHHYDLRSGADVVKLLCELNRTMSVTYQDRFMVSLGAIWINEGAETVEVCAAGFPPMIVQGADGELRTLQVPGDPLGLGIASFSCQSREFPLRPGDRLLCFTDGCYEFEYEGRPFRRRALHDVFAASRDSAPAQACEEVRRRLRELRGKDYAEDDVTFVIIDRI